MAVQKIETQNDLGRPEIYISLKNVGELKCLKIFYVHTKALLDSTCVSN